MSKITKTIEKVLFCPQNRQNDLDNDEENISYIQISAVAKVTAKAVAKEALARPISARPCIRDLNLPPKNAFPFVFSEKDYDTSSTQGAEERGLFSVNLNKQSSYLVI